MGNWAAIFIKTNDIEDITARLESLSGLRNICRGAFPAEDLHGCWGSEATTAPTCLALAQTQPDWIMVRHNRLRAPAAWGVLLSLGDRVGDGAKVIMASGQSQSGFYHFSLYEHGRRLREIEYSYCAARTPINLGERLDFECEYPGRNILYGGAREYVFDYESIDVYAHHFGLEIVPDYEMIREWRILSPHAGGSSSREAAGRRCSGAIGV